jgi:hypothetical protein
MSKKLSRAIPKSCGWRLLQAAASGTFDDDEPQADVRVKKANLESAGIAMREARRAGAMPVQMPQAWHPGVPYFKYNNPFT